MPSEDPEIIVEVEALPGTAKLAPTIQRALQTAEPSRHKRAIEGVAVAALSGVPWVGGVAAAAAAYKDQSGALARDTLLAAWLDEHERRLDALRRTVEQLNDAFERMGEGIESRIESPEYLSLVRRAFRAWDRAETSEKRKAIADLLANAAGTQLTDDDVVRLFIDWIDTYDETHFAIVRAIYNHNGVTRGQIWQLMGRGRTPADNSADADLFRKLMDDLSRGRVIRQHRETNQFGQFMPKARSQRKPPGTVAPLKSAFDGTEAYELTALGEQFVHYAFTGAVTRIEGGDPSA
jgi:hypothetical protein